MRNTHISCKHCPVSSHDMLLPLSHVFKCHTAEHTSDFCCTSLSKCLMILDFPCCTKHLHCSCMCRHKSQCSILHLSFCLHHMLFIFLDLTYQIPAIPYHSSPHHVLTSSSNISLYIIVNHMFLLSPPSHIVHHLYYPPISVQLLHLYHQCVNVLKYNIDSHDMM